MVGFHATGGMYLVVSDVVDICCARGVLMLRGKITAGGNLMSDKKKFLYMTSASWSTTGATSEADADSSGAEAVAEVDLISS